MDIAKEINARLTTREVFAKYGLAPNRAGFVCCFEHMEKTPSMKVYDGNRGYHCFGCHASGDTINFVQRYFNLDFKGAIAKLNDDFGLGLPVTSEITQAERVEMARKEYYRRKARELWQKELERLDGIYYYRLDDVIRLERQKVEFCPMSKDDEFDPKFIEALQNLSLAYYDLETAAIERAAHEKQRSY